MRNAQYQNSGILGIGDLNLSFSRKTAIGGILIIALIAFEIFNFDTTRFALDNLLGNVRFLGLPWAAILAVAFCSIDFAGLVRLFTPEKGRNEPKEVWYLMGAWLLGATMNALMTWWAVSLTLLNHTFGNEVLSRDQLLQVVPIFVAVLVWLTRILFIGAFTVAGDRIFNGDEDGRSTAPSLPAQPVRATGAQVSAAPKRDQPTAAQPTRNNSGNRRPTTYQEEPAPSLTGNRRHQIEAAPIQSAMQQPMVEPAPEPDVLRLPVRENNSRVRQRPPQPNGARKVGFGMQARGQDN